MAKDIVLENVRLSFPSMFNKAIFEGVERKYEATFLISKDDPQAEKIEKAAKAFAIEYFGEGKVPKSLKYTAIIDGDTKDYDGYENCVAVKGASGKRFPIVDRDNTPLAEEDNKPEAGDYVHAVIGFWYSDHPKGGKQILANVKAIRFYKEGEKFGQGSVDVDDAFADVKDNFEDEDDL